MIEYKLLFPEQYEEVEYVKQKVIENKKQSSRWDEEERKSLNEYVNNYIAKFITDDMIKKNFSNKCKIYDHACNDELLLRTWIKDKNNDSSNGFITNLKDLFLESRFSKILNLESEANKIYKDMLNNPKLCIALIKSETAADFSWNSRNCEEEFFVESILAKAYRSIKEGEAFILSPVEKEVFLKMIFGRNYAFDGLLQKEIREWKNFKNTIELYNQIYKAEEKFGNEKEINKNEKIITKDSMDPSDEDEEIKIRKYLSGFCHDMMKNKSYNPILKTPTKKYDIKDEKRRKSTWFELNSTEKGILKKCYAIKDYLEESYSDITLKKYCHFVIKYLKDLKDKNLDQRTKILNIYLFEQVFGFGYINSVAEMLQEKFQNVDLFNTQLGPWSEFCELLGLVMTKFEPCVRIAIAEKITDAYLYEIYSGLDVEEYEGKEGNDEKYQRDEERSYRYFEAMCNFLDDCRRYISMKERKLSYPEKIEDIEIKESELYYNEILNYEYKYKDELRNIDSDTGEKYLRRMEKKMGDKKIYMENILQYIKVVCWEFNVYGF